MTAPEGESCPSPGSRDGHLFLARDEAHRVRSEGDASRDVTEVLIRLPPDRGPEGSHGFLSRARRGAAGHGGDPPLRPLRDHGGVERRHRLPPASRRRHTRPRRRESGVRELEALWLVGLRELIDDDIALELGISMHDAHREDRRCLIEQAVGGECRGREGEYAARRLQPHSFVGDPGRSPHERQDVFRRVGVGEEEVMRHAF